MSGMKSSAAPNVLFLPFDQRNSYKAEHSNSFLAMSSPLARDRINYPDEVALYNTKSR